MSEITSPKPFVFVLMPFSEDFDDIYKLGIKAASQEANTYCERVDEQIFTDSILERIYNQIAKSDLIVADMTYRNPNVFYETGYAHALGKQVILLTQSSDDIPFDMKHYPHIIYKKDNISYLKDELKRRIEWITSNTDKKLSLSEAYLEYSVYGNIITEGYIVKVPTINLNSLDIRIIAFSISAHNPSNLPLKLENVNVGIKGPWVSGVSLDIVNNRLGVLNNSMYLVDKRNITPVDAKNAVAFFTLPNQLFPDSWFTLSCNFGIYGRSEQEFPCSIKLYTEIGTPELNFKLLLTDSVELDSKNKK